ncbi:MAG: Gldg family protein [Lachnospiraceae bacterium]|nr:Gldg family protein [Lachnospiraceae bacterium]
MKKLLNSFKTKAFRVGGYSVVAAVIVLAIVIAANLLINALPSHIKMIDLSQNLLYSFSDQTKKIVSEADRDVNIYMICQTGYENSTLTNLLDRYNELSSRIHIIPIDTNNSPTFATTYGLSEVPNNSLLVASDLRYRYIAASDIFETTPMYDKDGKYIGTSSNLDGESEVTSAINYCLMKELPKVYQLTGHGEEQLPEEYVTAISRLNLTVEDLNLLTVSSIPEECDTLLFLDPKGDLNESEYGILSEFLGRGGRLLLVTTPRLYERPWLDKLMADYDMREETGIVAEGDASYYAASGDPTYLLPSITDHTITKPIVDNRYIIFMPIASGIKRTGTDANITLTQLLKTSGDAYSMIDGYNRTSFEKRDGDISGPFSLATLMVRADPDYIHDDTMIMWFSSSAIIDEEIDRLVSGANMDLFLNSLSFICDQTNSISIHSKSLNYRYLNVSGSQATFWSVILIGVLPAACLAVGLIIFLRRRKK